MRVREREEEKPRMPGRVSPWGMCPGPLIIYAFRHNLSPSPSASAYMKAEWLDFALEWEGAAAARFQSPD